jgi:hypothetical protein
VYGFKKHNISVLSRVSNHWFLGVQEQAQSGLIGTMVAITASYFFLIVWFSNTYTYLAYHTPGSFDKVTVEFGDAIYLSFTAISVGPAGLNPISDLAKAAVMCEIGVGLFFAVLVFSALAEQLKRKDASTN